MRNPEILKQIEIGFVTVVMIAGAIGRVAILDVARQRGKPLPDRFTFAIGARGPLDLGRRRGRTPHEAIRELVCRHECRRQVRRHQ